MVAGAAAIAAPALVVGSALRARLAMGLAKVALRMSFGTGWSRRRWRLRRLWRQGARATFPDMVEDVDDPDKLMMSGSWVTEVCVSRCA